MKSIQKLLIFIFLPLFFSCTDEIDLEIETELTVTEGQRTNGQNFNIPVNTNSSLIIQYFEGVPEADKVAFRRRHLSQNEIDNIEICHCSEKDIERWQLDSIVQIEPKKETIIDDPLGDGKLMAVNRDFNVKMHVGGVVSSTTEDLSYVSHIKSSNMGVNVALMDTGFDPTFSRFKDEFGTPLSILYNSSETNVAGESSGWNFVENNSNTFDDHIEKHGTALMHIYKEILDSYGIPHQFLPLKVFDEDGNSNYFETLCATRYAAERSDIIQMSFGWLDGSDDTEKYSIFSNLLETFDDVVVIASAGNTGNNNDLISHYPSSFSNSNVISVAATNKYKTDIAYFSNYGPLSVDLFARGEGITFYDKFGTPLVDDLEGTSFAAPQVGAMAAKYLYMSGMSLSPSEVLNSLDYNGTLVTYTGKVKFDKFIDTPLE